MQVRLLQVKPISDLILRELKSKLLKAKALIEYMSETANQEILQELKNIKKELDFIKDHMVDVDTLMTAEEEQQFQKAMKEHKEGKTTSLGDLKKELGM